MIKEDILQYKERWRLANEAITEDLRHTPVEVKLRQLAVMFEAAHSLGWSDRLRQGEEDVRQRWRLLRERLNG